MRNFLLTYNGMARSLFDPNTDLQVIAYLSSTTAYAWRQNITFMEASD